MPHFSFWEIYQYYWGVVLIAIHNILGALAECKVLILFTGKFSQMVNTL